MEEINIKLRSPTLRQLTVPRPSLGFANGFKEVALSVASECGDG